MARTSGGGISARERRDPDVERSGPAHYGREAEKLAEFGLQPFRSEPRVRLVGPDGKQLKRSKATTETAVQVSDTAR